MVQCACGCMFLWARRSQWILGWLSDEHWWIFLWRLRFQAHRTQLWHLCCGSGYRSLCLRSKWVVYGAIFPVSQWNSFKRHRITQCEQNHAYGFHSVSLKSVAIPLLMFILRADHTLLLRACVHTSLHTVMFTLRADHILLLRAYVHTSLCPCVHFYLSNWVELQLLIKLSASLYIRFPGIQVTNDCEQPCGCRRKNLDPLQGQ